MEEGLHGTKASVGKAAAQAFSSVVALIEMVIVEEGVELRMEGLDLGL